MITVEDLLMAYASAYDAWLDPEAERKNPTPEYAELICQVVSFENAKLREFVADLMAYLKEAERVHSDRLIPDSYYDRARELGVEVIQ